MNDINLAQEQIGTMTSAAVNRSPVTGIGEGPVNQATRAASQAIRAAASVVNKAVPSAEATALNIRIHPEGRADAVRGLQEQVSSEVTGALATAEAALTVAQAHVTLDARPKLSGNPEAAEAHLDRMLSRTRQEDKVKVIQEMASRDNSDVAGVLFTEQGRDLMQAHGIDPAFFPALDVYALNAAEHSTDSKRRQAYAAGKQLAQMKGAVDGVRAASEAATEALKTLHAKAGHDPRDVELRALRAAVATQRGHARHG